MDLPPAPSMSRNAIDKAGELLASDDTSIGQVENARRQIAEWRAGHLRPLHCIADDLVERLARLGMQAIVAMRLKRLFRIEAKLQIHEGMAVSRMQDIAGIRIIVSSIGDVETLAQDIQNNPPACAEIRRAYDYIAAPKDNGYRSIHLALRYKEPGTGYDGLQVEMQIRTEAEHAWASSVEVNGMTSGHHIKYDEGEPQWGRFFQLAAELIARDEGTASLAEFAGVDAKEIIEELRSLAEQLKAFDTMRSYRVRNHREVPKIKIGNDAIGACFLFEFGNDPKDLRITVFGIDKQEDAILSYANAEQQLSFESGHLAPILVSVSAVEKLQVAYQTFFLDCTPFVERIRRLLGQ